MIVLKSLKEIARMRAPCSIVAEVLALVVEAVEPGVTTLELNAIAEREVAKRKAKPAFRGYSGFPCSLCCSLNEQVVHGIPNSTPLKDGDIISLDFGAYYDGFFGDAAVTVPVGSISATASNLIKVTERSLYIAIDKAINGNRLSDISNSVQFFVESNGYSVVRDFVGHGIGRNLHEQPQIPNYGDANKGPKLKQGMVLALEPMVNEKSYEVKVLADGWTAVTVDGGLSAHFEHTVAITENGPEILTLI
ncbi:MAG: type I methionyl aminopeptidase [Geobacteraceae bacterium]|nr:type I methionyl aminopeptidase [Geobacteraceae bacterium]